MASHLETVQQIYAAFAVRDIGAILATLDPEVCWEPESAVFEVPWLRPRRGAHQVAEFFHSLELLQFEVFRPTRFLADDELVVVLVDVLARVRRTGRPIIETDEVHLWHFNASGRVIRFRHRVDTLKHLLAHSGPWAIEARHPVR
jgi:uncharacterized protein